MISWGPEVRYGRNYSFARVLADENFRAGLTADFARNIRYSFDLDRDMERYSYQFTDRLTLRNITEFNTYDRTVGLNLLASYRVNSGTAFYIGTTITTSSTNSSTIR